MAALLEWIKANKVKVGIIGTAVVTAVTAAAPEHTIAYKAAVALGKLLVQLAGQ
jgi:hypothetical protein